MLNRRGGAPRPAHRAEEREQAAEHGDAAARPHQADQRVDRVPFAGADDERPVTADGAGGRAGERVASKEPGMLRRFAGWLVVAVLVLLRKRRRRPDPSATGRRV